MSKVASCDVSKMNVNGKNHLECLADSMDSVTPQSHQRKICEFMTSNPSKKGILIFHGLGTGKTLTSIFLLKCLVKSKVSGLILVPKSLVGNYNKELEKIKGDYKKNIEVSSYDTIFNKIKKGEINCRNRIVIVDEAHNFRNKNSQRSQSLATCSQKANKVILLSATPVYNNPDDIVNLMTLITNFDHRKVKKMLYGLPHEFAGLFDCNTSYYQVSRDNSDFPQVKEHVKRFEMDRTYYEQYRKIENNEREGLPDMFMETKNLVTFYNGIRRAVNHLDYPSKKINFTLKKIIESVKTGKKILIYSNWKDAGINIIKDLLNENKIPHVQISGDMTDVARDNSVKLYNKGKVKIMLITSAGGEGISLKETRTVIIMEPYWNEEKLKQVMGRAVRYRSHAKLPIEDRTVDIYTLLLVKPKGFSKELRSADELLYLKSQFKSKQIINFYKKLIPMTIENSPRCN